MKVYVVFRIYHLADLKISCENLERIFDSEEKAKKYTASVPKWFVTREMEVE